MTTDWVKTNSTRAVFLGYQIRSASLEIGRKLSHIVEAVDCTISEFYILRANWDKGTLRQAEIAAYSDLTQPEMSEAFKGLTHKKFIAPVHDETDTHKTCYKITETGLQVRDSLVEKYSNYMTSLCSGLSQKDIEQTLYVLMKFHENIHMKTEHSSSVAPIR